MPTVKIDDQIITTVQAWKYAQALNDGNLPAKIEAYLNATGHFSDEFTDVIDVDLADTGSQFTKTWKLFEPVTNGMTARLHVTPSTSAVATSYITIKLLEGTTIGPHLKVQMDTGLIYYSTDNGANWTTTGITATLDVAGYIFIVLNVTADTFTVAYSTTTTTGAPSAAFAMDNTITTGIDTVKILSTPDAHPGAATGQEDFEHVVTTAEYHVDDNIIGKSGAIGDWSDGGGSGSYTCKIAAGQVLECIDDVAGEYYWPKLTFDTQGHVGDKISFEYKTSSLTGGQVFIYGDGGGLYLQLPHFDGTGNVMAYNNATTQVDTHQDITAGAWYTWWIKFTGTNSFRIVVTAGQGVAEPDWDTVHDHQARVAIVNHVQGFGCIAVGNATMTTTIDNIRPSWTYVAGAADPIEVHVEDIWSDQDCVDPSDVKGRGVKIFNDDSELIWKGYVKDFQKHVQEGSVDYMLHCVDEFYQAAKHDVSLSNIIHQSTVANPGLDFNEVTIVDAFITPAQAEGKFMLLRHASGKIKYDQASGDYENLAMTGAAVRSSTPGVYVTVRAGAWTDTLTINGAHYSFDIHGHLANTFAEATYIEFTLSRVVDATPEQTPLEGKVRLVAQTTPAGSVGVGVMHVYVYNKVTLGWDKLYILNAATTTGWNADASAVIPIDENHIVTGGGNWTVTVRIHLSNVATMFDWILWVDCIRCDITCKKTSSFVPVESRIDSDPHATSTVFQTNAIPIAEDISLPGDAAIICDPVMQALTQALSRVSGVTKDIDDPYLACPSDERGNSGFDAFKRICGRYGLDFFLDVAAADTYTTLRARANKGYVDSVGFADAVEVQSAFGVSRNWGRHTTEDLRVDVDKISKLGSVFRFPFLNDGADKCHDAVYYMLTTDLSTAAPRTQKAFEFYFSFSGTPPAVGSVRWMTIFFNDTSDPDGGGTPYLHIYYCKVGAVYYWKAQLCGTLFTSDEMTVEVDANNTMGIRVVFDTTTLHVLAYKRAVTVDGTRKLGDTWLPFDNQDDCTCNAAGVRSIAFLDGSTGVAAWAVSYINLHLIKIEYVPEDFDGGAMTPGGDIDVQKKDDAIASLTIIGGKDASDVQIDPFAVVDGGLFDPAGARVVKLMPSLKSEAEIKRYADDFLAAYADDLNAIKMSKYIDSTSVFKCGYYYQFTIDGVNYDEQLRRLEASWEPKDNGISYTLEFGAGRTFGKEKLFNAAKRNDADINELKLR